MDNDGISVDDSGTQYEQSLIVRTLIQGVGAPGATLGRPANIS